MVGLEHAASGKVREIYTIDEERLLIVATDRISAYDVVLRDQIPDKGKVLTGLTLFWLEKLEVANHLLSTDVAEVPASPDADLSGRSMIVRRCDPLPIECVVRGYLYGSAWREYADGGGPATEHLPPGLVMGGRLPDPIFTPSTKAEIGHDENLTERQARDLVGSDLYETVRELSIQLYREAARHAREQGILLADTKFEFGYFGTELLLIDEVLTPDSSRYWPTSEWHPPKDTPSYDKQYVRDWLDQIGWDRRPPAPDLPAEVVRGTRDRYVHAYERLTGRKFDDYLAATR